MQNRSNHRVSPKVAILGALVVISFVLGLFLGDDLVFAGVPIIIYLALVFLQSEGPHAEVTVSRFLEKAQLYEDDNSRVKLSITNTGIKPIPFLSIEDSVPRDLRDSFTSPDHNPSFTLSLKPRESRDELYALRANNFGIFSVGPIKVKSEDSFGFASLDLNVDSFSTVVVLPKMTERLSHFKIRPRKTKPWPGEIVAKKVGLGMDNYSIRQYIPGDSFRRINWRATARSSGRDSNPDPLLNEQTAELGADTIVIVDARPASNIISSSGESLVSNSVRAAISITDKLLRDRNRVGLVTIGVSTDRIAPGYGRRQYNRLTLSLIRVRAGGFFTFDNVSSYLKFFYPHLAQVVLISPLIDFEALVAAAEIARSGYELLVVSPNPVDFSPAKAESGVKVLRRNWSEGERTLRISVELAELARNSNLAQLRNAGIFVLDWRKHDQLDHTFSKNLRAWSRQVEWTRSKATQG